MITINGNSSVKLYGVSIGSVLSGSILFSGNVSSYLSINNDIDFRFRTGDFTVEWFQYETDNKSFPRPWTLGSWPNSNIGVSLEDGDFLFWYDGSTGTNVYYNFGNIGEYKNQWVHFAIIRENSIIKVFKNGIQIGLDFNLSYDFNDTASTFWIGGDIAYDIGVFGGNITNFRWIKGTAIYTSNFITPITPLKSVTNTKLLLIAPNSTNAWKDYSLSNKNILNSNTTWSSDSPF